MATERPRKILFIRRDNIGDLVCTTPAIRAVRRLLPDARICVLVNSYNAPAIERNPDVDAVYVYTKTKHTERGAVSVWFDNLRVIRRIRKERFDVAIGCNHGWSGRTAKYAVMTGAKVTIGYVRGDKDTRSRSYTRALPEPGPEVHEVESMMELVRPLGVEGPAPAMVIRPDPEEVQRLRDRLAGRGMGPDERIVAVHISSRKPQNRWPEACFEELCRTLAREHGLRVLLLWSPGSESNPTHPGDDEKAGRIIESTDPSPVGVRTGSLSELIAALSIADHVVCSDGGAMHIAAALGKPLVTIWGSTDPRRWSPWGVPHVILQKGGGNAADVTPEEVVSAFVRLAAGEAVAAEPTGAAGSGDGKGGAG